MSLSSLFHSAVKEGNKIISEKVNPGFDIGDITDVTTSSRTKLHLPRIMEIRRWLIIHIL